MEAKERDTASITTTQDPLLTSPRGGIRCPHCNCAHHTVTQTRTSEANWDGIKREYVLRWRQCRHCGCTFKTREVVEPEIPDIIKSPSQAAKVKEIIRETMGNVIPPTKPFGKDMPELKNPFL